MLPVGPECQDAVIALLLRRWWRLRRCRHAHGCLVKSQIKCTLALLRGKPSRAISPASQSEAQTGCDLTLCSTWRGRRVISEWRGKRRSHDKERIQVCHKERKRLTPRLYSFCTAERKVSRMIQCFRSEVKRRPGTHWLLGAPSGVLNAPNWEAFLTHYSNKVELNSTPCRGEVTTLLLLGDIRCDWAVPPTGSSLSKKLHYLSELSLYRGGEGNRKREIKSLW